MDENRVPEDIATETRVPFSYRFREFVRFNPENANDTPTEKSTGTSGREDDYDTP